MHSPSRAMAEESKRHSSTEGTTSQVSAEQAQGNRIVIKMPRKRKTAPALQTELSGRTAPPVDDLPRPNDTGTDPQLSALQGNSDDEDDDRSDTGSVGTESCGPPFPSVPSPLTRTNSTIDAVERMLGPIMSAITASQKELSQQMKSEIARLDKQHRKSQRKRDEQVHLRGSRNGGEYKRLSAIIKVLHESTPQLTSSFVEELRAFIVDYDGSLFSSDC